MFATLVPLFAQAPLEKTAPAGPLHWYPESFAMAILSTLTFGCVGVVLAIVAFKVFDWITPGNLAEEILQKQNIAAAIVVGAFLVGICIIVAAAIM